MPEIDATSELPAVVEGHPATVAVRIPVPACDLTPYLTPGLPPPAGLNDLGVAWTFLDPGVLRTYRYLARLTHRPDAEIARRAAVLLRADPQTHGTPVRCYECHNVYTVAPDEPDWGVAGREDGLCFGCMTSMPRVLEGTIVSKPAIEAGTDPA